MCSEIEETFKMIEEEADRLREERRAKMKEIKENMSNGLWREGKNNPKPKYVPKNTSDSNF